jgi:AcrR family transcriptional regulator
MAGSVRQSRGEATRNAILVVARRLFSDFGYHNTGIADIQAATGLTKGAFYHHFRAKQDLALAVLDVVEQDYDVELFEPAMSQATPGRQLAALLDRLVSLNSGPEWRNCLLLVTLFAEVNSADGALARRVQDLQAGMLDKLAQMVQQAQQTDEAALGSAGIWARYIMSTLFGLALIRKTGVVQAESPEVIALLKRTLLLDGIAAQPAEVHAPSVGPSSQDAE